MFEDYIGKWVVESMEVDKDRIMSDLLVIRSIPTEFIFSYETAVSVASRILNEDENKIDFECELDYIYRINNDKMSNM